MTTKVTEKEFILLDGDKEVAVIDHIKGNNPFFALMMVEVKEDYQGQGMGEKILEAYYDFIKEEDTLVKVICPYARKWFIENPERQDIVHS